MLLWRDFIYTENCRGYARKSSKLFCNSAPKVEQYYLPSFYNLPSWCEHQIQFFTRLCRLHSSRNSTFFLLYSYFFPPMVLNFLVFVFLSLLFYLASSFFDFFLFLSSWFSFFLTFGDVLYMGMRSASIFWIHICLMFQL
jgi:hypothetical protein